MIRIPEWGHTVYLVLNLFPDSVHLPMKICPHIWQIPGVSLPGRFFGLQVLVIGHHNSPGSRHFLQRAVRHTILMVFYVILKVPQ